MACNFKNFIYLLLVLTLVAGKEIQPRVVGGVHDSAHEFPFTVVLQQAFPQGFLRICTGSIIAQNWVLTASHCFADNKEALRVKYGDPTIPSNETKYLVNVIKAVPHPGYKKTSIIANDIGLLKTEKMTNPTLVKLCAVDYRSFMGMPVKYAGFGLTNLLLNGETPGITEEHFDPPLLVGEAVVISCKQDEGLSSGRPAICIAPRCGVQQHPYFGDSGGPLTLHGRIIGVLNGFGTIEIPILGYGPVSPYLEWIYDTMHSH